MLTIKRILSTILFITLFVSLFSMTTQAYSEPYNKFYDVPLNHWAYENIHKLRALKITEGNGKNTFGLGQTITRAEFITFLIRLLDWEEVFHDKGSYDDNMDPNQWYYNSIETALSHNVITKEYSNIRPKDPITREEMAIMIVKSLGYEYLAEKYKNNESPFSDVTSNIGYMTLLNDFNIINGVGDGKFAPNNTAKREEAAAILIRMYDKINQSINQLHAFYSTSAYSQMGFIKSLNSVSFDWSVLEYNSTTDTVHLNMAKVPLGFTEPVNYAASNAVTSQLNLYASNSNVILTQDEQSIGIIEYVLSDELKRQHLIENIINQIKNTSIHNETITFDGIIIDFEEMRGQYLRNLYNDFLVELKDKLLIYNKTLTVAVHPYRTNQEYFDAYDFKTIGQVADKVILMAHDYQATTLTDYEMTIGYADTPLTPIKDIYDALKAITNPDTGIEDTSKIMLQISFDSAQWGLSDGQVINQNAYRPTYDLIYNRLIDEATTINYGTKSMNPYATYYNTEKHKDYVIWYEDSRSITEKIKLAKMFNITGLSLWRLGNIPNYSENDTKPVFLDVWQQILNQ